ncbi:MAG: hypothetical protein LPJ89_09415 [Hymenobacteraceae bacterium]|nr:hypothetical protein [Hymenobacteraceae bacterium]MDX5395558.1 hypothetical protein [Hymenobacteraceae bacterium]MDX5443984.1 hypothetical protein [Hymenobacteraceae bacterium]MDX5511612.1 hypothetical protein [Hymenobacteraceae bacterium]
MNKYLAIESLHMRTRRHIIVAIPVFFLITMLAFISAYESESGIFIFGETDTKLMLFRVANGRFYASILVYWFIFEAAYGHQKGTYRRYLTDGLSRSDLFIKQLLSILLYTVATLLVIQILLAGFAIYHGIPLSDLILNQHLPSWINQVLLLVYILSAGLLFANLTGNFYAILLYILWGIIESLIFALNNKFLEWEWLNNLPLASSRWLVGDEFLSTSQVLLLSGYFALFILLNYIILKKKTL